MSGKSLRRENLKFLVACYGTQTALAQFLEHPSLTQPIISSVLRRKRRLHDSEVRDIEQKLSIPESWFDNYPIAKAWTLIRELRDTPPETQRIFLGLLGFVADNQRPQT